MTQHKQSHRMTCHSRSPHVTSQPTTLLHLTLQEISWHQNRPHHITTMALLVFCYGLNGENRQTYDLPLNCHMLSIQQNGLCDFLAHDGALMHLVFCFFLLLLPSGWFGGTRFFLSVTWVAHKLHNKSNCVSGCLPTDFTVNAEQKRFQQICHWETNLHEAPCFLSMLEDVWAWVASFLTHLLMLDAHVFPKYLCFVGCSRI